MAWADVTLPTDTYTDIPVPNMPATYLTDQNGDIMTDQNGSPIVVQEGSGTSTNWADIT
jgi:hypothetical protein